MLSLLVHYFLKYISIGNILTYNGIQLRSVLYARICLVHKRYIYRRDPFVSNRLKSNHRLSFKFIFEIVDSDQLLSKSYALNHALNHQNIFFKRW